MSKGKVKFKDIEKVKRNDTNPIMTGGNNENFIDEAMIRAGLWSINRSLKNKNRSFPHEQAEGNDQFFC